MEYFVILVLFLIGFVAAFLRILEGLFWIVLIATLGSWLLSVIFRIVDEFELYQIFYGIWFLGRLAVATLFVVLLLSKWLIPWVFG